MSKALFRVEKPGLLTTIQDAGRTGYQQYGIVVGGAMDRFSLHIANILVGNPPNEAALEVTLVGPTLEALADTVISICGANLSPTVNGERVPLWKSFLVKTGQKIEFGKPIEGARAYISVAGGFDVPLVMGSKSTDLKAAIGGGNGRALEKNTMLYGIDGDFSKRRRSLNIAEIPQYPKELTIRVVLGPHLQAFPSSTIELFLSSTYTISTQSDRMGYRLKGPRLVHKSSADIISEAIPLGGIQVPDNGEPIILMADRQTTGGYTRIATVISTDIPKLAQATTGCSVRFTAVSVEEAQQIYLEENRFIRMLDRLSR
jgi:antagonist of KipI